MISNKSLRAIWAARGRKGGKWRGKKLPTRRVVIGLLSSGIINQVLKEKLK